MTLDYYARVFVTEDAKVRGLCCKPYPLHPRGCPNFGKKVGCPPKCPLITDTIDTAKPVYAIYNRFDLQSHVEAMKEKHPDWSERQLYCVLYWQPKARKQLKEKIRKFCHLFKELKVIGCPEAQGVNLTATMRTAGIELEWPPRKFAYQIVLAGAAK